MNKCMADFLSRRRKRTINGEPFNPKDVESRQQRRACDRREAFNSITQRFGAEPRKLRRSMALGLARNIMRQRQAV
jgi:hypothetical protein